MAAAHAKAPQSPAAKGRRKAETYRLEHQVGFLLRCAHQRASEMFKAVMGRFGVTPRQFAALAKLDDLGSVSQNQLGRLTAMDPATISGVIARLAARGYVAQAADPRDARLLSLGLTTAGAAAIGAMKEVAAEVSQRTLAALSEEEAAAFLKALGKIGQMPCLPRPASRP
jgi:MarR family transcriptional regulator, lower aerobic nicotinate degradation pathway regulator